MATFDSPGVFPQEIDLSTTVAASSTTVLGLVGVFERGPVGEATLVTSLADALRKFGTYVDGHYGMHALRNYFENGGQLAQVVRTVHYVGGVSQAVEATVSLDDRAGSPLATLQVDAASPGAWGNNLTVSIEASAAFPTTGFNLIVKENGSVVEEFSDLLIGTANQTDDDWVERRINGVSEYIAVTDLSSATAAPNNLPALQADTALASGDDGLTSLAPADYVGDSGTGNGLYALDAVDVSLVTIPGETGLGTSDVIAPGIVDYCAAREDCFGIVDTPDGLSVSDLIEFRDAGGSWAHSAFNSSYGGLFTPWFNDVDPATGRALAVPPSGIVAGIYARSDEALGPWAAAAGLDRGQARGVQSARAEYSKAQNDLLAQKQINPFRRISGATVLWGQKNLQIKASSTDRISVRRLLIFVRGALTDAGAAFIFQPNTEATRQAVVRTFTPFLQRLQDNEGIAEFQVISDASNNPVADVQNGILRVRVLVRPVAAVEFLPIDIVITNEDIS